MSLKVELSDLPAQISNFEFAYLLTVDDDQRPRAVGVVPVVEGHILDLGQLGKRTLANIDARAQVSLVWPPTRAAGHSLIVDGNASNQGGGGGGDGDAEDAERARVIFTPTSAILHRPVKP